MTPITTGRNLDVPMRDGVHLFANLYKPPANGRYPVIMSVTPYGKDKLPDRVANFIICAQPHKCPLPFPHRLAAAAGAAAAHAAVAATVARHDAAAEAAAGRVSEIDDARQSVGGVDRTSPEC